MKRLYVLLLLLPLVLAGCTAPAVEGSPALCRVVLEEGEGFRTDQPARQVVRGEDVSFRLQVADGYQVTGADHQDYTLTPTGAGEVTLTLHRVLWSTAVSVTVDFSGAQLLYHANGGLRLDGGNPEQAVPVPVTPSHLRWNTSQGTQLFAREDHTLTGWNTAPDGSGMAVGLGSRILPQEGQTLYAQWSPWTDPSLFTWEQVGEGAVITGYRGHEGTVTLPARLSGLPVRRVSAGAMARADCRRLILPDTLWELEDGAFSNCAVEEVYLFDSLRSVSDYSFAGCAALSVLHINAALPPVYSGTYFDTFQDKYDRLLSLAGRPKLILFSGSSTRFGYDSALLDRSLPGYEVVNMGVFAYTNALPQLMLIMDCVQEGDILLHAPEFDAAQRQFCTTDRLDAPFFCMMESNYDAVSRLDLRQFSQVFTAFSSYLRTRRDMEPRSYALSPSSFDEDGAPVDTPSYNEYGDYILYRPDAASDQPVYGLEVGYTTADFPLELYILPVNAVYRRFLDRGVHVYFTYAPRNRYALTPESTPAARAQLHRFFQEELAVPVISQLEDSLWPGTLLYGTDNHLSTQGVRLRTERILAELLEQMALDGLEVGG